MSAFPTWAQFSRSGSGTALSAAPSTASGSRSLYVELEPGVTVPEHSHENEQQGMVLTGSLTFTVGGETRQLGPGKRGASRERSALGRRGPRRRGDHRGLLARARGLVGAGAGRGRARRAGPRALRALAGGAGRAARFFSRSFFLRCRSFAQRRVGLDPLPIGGHSSGRGRTGTRLRFAHAGGEAEEAQADASAPAAAPSRQADDRPTRRRDDPLLREALLALAPARHRPGRGRRWPATTRASIPGSRRSSWPGSSLASASYVGACVLVSGARPPRRILFDRVRRGVSRRRCRSSSASSGSRRSGSSCR